MLGVHIDGGVISREGCWLRETDPQDAVLSVCEIVGSGRGQRGKGQESLPCEDSWREKQGRSAPSSSSSF